MRIWKWTRRERRSFEWHIGLRRGDDRHDREVVGFRGQVAGNWHFGLASLELSIDGGDHELSVTVTLWRLFVYLAIVVPSVVRSFAKHYQYRTEEITVFDLDLGSTVRWGFWLDGMQRSLPGSYDRAPKWRDGHLDLADLVFGRVIYTNEIVKDGMEVVVPLPEKPYPATARFERSTWRRPRKPGLLVREDTWLEIPNGGLPHAGKGENSWDCDDDGITGIGATGHSLPKAIAHAVERTLEAREKYGLPSTLRT